ncbi:hypothetical protein BXZ70DRAFT_911564 [Cristinia sonorae]|uniref:Uncharacterized protein n=1 Tax=Cristinia sonorae TaxID=1940300 RepID=A0A8K0UCU1_9AGAR|nr:hypothetical protein BXZ70DRAFT_911564 [Cristinia sonorae]
MPAKSRAASPQDTSDFEQVEVMSSDYEEPPKARGRGRGRARGRGRGAGRGRGRGRGRGKAAPSTPSTTRARKTPKSKEYIDSDDDAETGAVDSEAEEVGAAQIEKEERRASFEAEREEEEIEGDDVQSDDGFTVVKTKSTARRSRSSPGRVLVPDSDEEVTKKASPSKRKSAGRILVADSEEENVPPPSRSKAKAKATLVAESSAPHVVVPDSEDDGLVAAKPRGRRMEMSLSPPRRRRMRVSPSPEAPPPRGRGRKASPPPDLSEEEDSEPPVMIPQTPSRAAAKARQNTPHPVKSAQSTASKYRERAQSDDSMEEAPRLSARAKGKAKAVEIFSSDDNMDVSVDETTDLISKVALKTPVSNKKAMRRNYEHSRGRDSPMYSTGGDDDEWSMREPGDNLPAPLKSAKKKVTVMTPPSPSPEKKIKAKSYSRKRRASTSEENDDNVPEEKVHATPSKIKKTSDGARHRIPSLKFKGKKQAAEDSEMEESGSEAGQQPSPSKSKKTLPPADQIFLSDEEKQPSFDLKVKGVQSKLKKAFPREAVGDPNKNPWVLFRHKDTNEPYYPFDCVALKQFAEDRRLKDAGSDQISTNGGAVVVQHEEESSLEGAYGSAHVLEEHMDCLCTTLFFKVVKYLHNIHVGYIYMGTYLFGSV